MTKSTRSDTARLATKTRPQTLDAIDQRVLLELDRDPRATVMLIAERTGLARGTVRSRLERLERDGALRAHSARLQPEALGLGLRAIVCAQVDQNEFGETIQALAAIPEVVECSGVSGRDDMHCQVVARDPEHLYLVTRRIMRCRGVQRTSTSIVLTEFIAYRTTQLLDSATA
ncbi:MAG: Lrp/AsnC family transcriptional regulator [Microbacteriaceae bacterium]